MSMVVKDLVDTLSAYDEFCIVDSNNGRVFRGLPRDVPQELYNRKVEKTVLQMIKTYLDNKPIYVVHISK